MSKSKVKSVSYLELIRIPAFSIFWAGRIVSGLGDILFTMATMWYVLSSTNSAVATAIVPLIPMLSFLILSMPLGTIADRLPKKMTLIGTDVFRGVVVIVVFILMGRGLIHSFDIYIANFLLSVAGMLFRPAEQAALPSILPTREKQLPAANGLLVATTRSIELFGYGLGGLLVAWLGSAHAVLIDGLSFFLSAISFMFIAVPSMRSRAERGVRAFVKDSVQGIRFIWGRLPLRILIIFGALVNMFAAPLEIFTSVFSKEVLHAGLAGYGYLEAAAAAGGLIGALVSGKVAHKLKLWKWMLVSFVVGGLALALMAVFPNLLLSVILFGLSMAANALLNIPLVSSLQLLAPDHMRGRIMTSFGLFFSSSMPIGLIAGGWLTSTFGPRLVFSAVGVLMMAMGLVCLFIKTLRSDELGVKEESTLSG